MYIKQLQELAKIIIGAQKPAADGEYVLYAAEGQLCIDRDKPRTANNTPICTINAEHINKGLPHALWWSICSALWRYKQKGLL